MQAGERRWDMLPRRSDRSLHPAAAMSVGDYEAVATQSAAMEVVAPTADAHRARRPDETARADGDTHGGATRSRGDGRTGTDEASESTRPRPSRRRHGARQRSGAPEPSGGGGFGYGVQAHMLQNGQAGQSMAMVAGMGFNWIKQQIEWKLIEPGKGDYQWGAIDEIVNAANAAGINVLFSVVKAPALGPARRRRHRRRGAARQPAGLRRLHRRHGRPLQRPRRRPTRSGTSRTCTMSGATRPIDPGRYVGCCKLAYAAVKADDPGAMVISGALTPTGAPGAVAMDDFAYLEEMYQAGLKNYCDAVGAHPSGYQQAARRRLEHASAIRRPAFRGPSDNRHHSWFFRATMEGYRNIIVTYGDGGKRIWPTEFGWASVGLCPDRRLRVRRRQHAERTGRSARCGPTRWAATGAGSGRCSCGT